MKSFSFLVVAVSLFAISCERHEFDGPNGTRQLHDHHGAHHDDGHGKADSHGKADAHGDEAAKDAH